MINNKQTSHLADTSHKNYYFNNILSVNYSYLNGIIIYFFNYKCLHEVIFKYRLKKFRNF